MSIHANLNGPSIHESPPKALLRTDDHSTMYSEDLPQDRVQSPNKKKFRQLQHQDNSKYNLQSNLEEMSLGSDDSSEKVFAERLQVCTDHNNHNLNPSNLGDPIIDDSSDDFSHTTDIMPDLDTQYKFNSDPEGGESS